MGTIKDVKRLTTDSATACRPRLRILLCSPDLSHEPSLVHPGDGDISGRITATASEEATTTSATSNYTTKRRLSYRDCRLCPSGCFGKYLLLIGISVHSLFDTDASISIVSPTCAALLHMSLTQLPNICVVCTTGSQYLVASEVLTIVD